MTTKQYNRNGMSLKLTASLLAFLFIFTPLAPVLAKKVIKPRPIAYAIKSPLVKFKKDNSLLPEKQLVKVRKHILDNKLPQTFLDRLDTFEAQLKKTPKKESIFKKTFDFIAGNTATDKEKREAKNLLKQKSFRVETFEGDINTAPEKDYKKTFPDLNFGGTKKKEGILSRLFSSQEVFADASDDPNVYLAPGSEITFSQAIRDQTNALGKDPLKMLNFVRNEVRYIPYYGSKKGADGTLVELAGNDMDQASLLIAMLRYSNIPARYRYVNAKMNIRTVTDLLGVDSPIAAAQILSLEKIPYILYTDQNDDPLFFVVEHTYVEAYMPYGYSRGIDVNDGGILQWVPMDPSINAYYYEQLVDVVDYLKTNGFIIENFFENYLNNASGTLEPLEAFKNEVINKLASNPPTYFPNMTYSDSLMRFYPKIQNLEFIPGSLPFEISANLNTYDYLPASLRHLIKFTVKDKDSNVALTHLAYVSDLADRELLVTYNAATPNDQATIDTFDTIYDVVPLSLVLVKPVLKVNSNVVATGVASFTLGQSQKYIMEFIIPTRASSGLIVANSAEITERDILTGNTNAIALNTDRVVPPELRPREDVSSYSFMSNQMLYRAALDFLDRLQYTHGELANIIGADFTNVATSAAISNGIKVTYSSDQPYSFDWKGLRIDSSSDVKYFSRFSNSANTHKKEFVALFGLQASQDESDIFEDNFNVESVATVKGLKLVAKGQFPGVTMKKITQANESSIDSLNISADVKTAFHTAIAEGNIIYTPTQAVTYGEWNGLFYVTTNFDNEASYIIGEGLNGGYTIEQWDSGWENFWRSHLLLNLSANIISPTNNQSFIQGDLINWKAEYTSTFKDWIEQRFLDTNYYGTGNHIIRSGYGTNASVTFKINRTIIGEDGKNGNNDFTLDEEIDDVVNTTGLQTSNPDFRKVLKAIFQNESARGELKKMRYEPCVDKDYIYPNIINQHPFSTWRLPGKMPSGPDLVKGTQVDSLKTNHGKTPQEMLKAFTNYGMNLTDDDNDGIVEPTDNDGTLSIYEVWKNNDGVQHYSGPRNDQCTSLRITTANSQPAQLLLASSYGIGQVIYGLWAKAAFFDTGNPPEPAKDIWLLFKRKTNIEMAAQVIKYSWEHSDTNLGYQCDPGDRLWKAIYAYNGSGGSATQYANTACLTYKGLH